MSCRITTNSLSFLFSISLGLITISNFSAFGLPCPGMEELPIVNVTEGFVQGMCGVSRNGRSFFQFLGVPYAKVPGRFELSVPADSWEGVKSCTEFGPTCSDESDNEKDGLNLNIFTPRLGSENASLLPTVIFFHGGSFQSNSNKFYGPNYLMDDQNVVYVVINYRLGALGFLSTGDSSAPGNNGLKDQVMALKWIKKNIENFGGNKNNVTIMGQSAGSASVTYHLVSPMSKGLFHKAIAESSTFLDPWAFTRNPKPVAEKLAQLLNCSTSTTKEMVECLKKVPLKDLQKFRREAFVKWHAEPLAGFGPVIEHGPFDENTFLPKSPYELLIEGNLSNPNVPLLTGVTDQEGIYLWAYYIIYNNPITDQCLKDLQTNWTGVAPVGFYFDEVVTDSEKDNVSLKIRDFYFGSNPIDQNTFHNLVNLYSDRLFINSAAKFINLYAKHAPVYPYLYTFKNYWGLEFGFDGISKNISIGATHAAELDMLISPLFDKTRNEPDHNALSEKIIKLWTSFMATGVPTETYGKASSFPPVNAEEGLQKWYRLDTDTELIDNIFVDRMAFWESLGLNDNDFSSN